MNLLRLTALLIYTLGVFSFGTILLVWIRQSRLARWMGFRTRAHDPLRGFDFTGGVITFVCFAWFVVNLLLVLAPLSPGLDRGPLLTATFFLAFLFPPLIMQCAYAGAQAGGQPLPGRGWTVSLWAMYCVSQSISLFTVLGFYQVIDLPDTTVRRIVGISMGGLFTLAMVYSLLAAHRSRRTRETSEERSYRRLMLGLYVVVIPVGILIILDGVGWVRMTDLFAVLAPSLPIAFLFLGTYLKNRFEFFDLFVKRGLSLLLTIVLLTSCFGLALPWLESLDLGWARPWVYACALLPVALALPWLYRWLGRLLDTVWLGRRFATVEAMKYFLSVMQSATSERELLEESERGISAIVHAPARIDLELREAPSLEFDCALEVPIPSVEGRLGMIRLGRRDNKTPFFSEDVALLGSLAHVFSYQLENMRLQQRRREQEQQAKELSLHASRSELKALRAQINPHFLFNALNAIAGLIHKEPFRADKTVEQLAEVFRYTLRRSENEWARLEEELEFVRAYLEVEQARFGERLQFTLHVEDAVRSTPIPTMMVQTLVENAIKHGVAAIRGPGRVEIDAHRDGQRLRIQVADNGSGFLDEDARGGSPKLPRSSGYGLRNIRQRLQGYFGDDADLVAERDPAREMTVVSIVIPLSRISPESAAERPRKSTGRGSAG